MRQAYKIFALIRWKIPVLFLSSLSFKPIPLQGMVDIWEKLDLAQQDPRDLKPWIEQQRQSGQALSEARCLAEYLAQANNLEIGIQQISPQAYDELVTQCKNQGFTDIYYLSSNTDPIALEELGTIIKNPRALISLLLDKVTTLIYEGEPGKASETISLAQKLIEQHQLPEFYKLRFQQNLALIYDKLDDSRKLENALLPIDQFCQKDHYYRFCATHFRNRAIYLQHKNDSSGETQGLEKALLFLNQAQIKAKKANLAFDMAANQLVKASLHHNLGQNEKAKKSIEVSLAQFQSFSHSNYQLWLADAYVLAAKIYGSLQNESQAFAALHKAEKIYDPEIKEDKLKVEKIRLELNFQFNRFQDHHKSHKTILKLTNDIYQEKINNQESEKIGKMNLQLEEEKSKKLASELSLKSTELELSQTKIKNLSLIKILLGICMLGLTIVIGFYLKLRYQNIKILELQAFIKESILNRFLSPQLVKKVMEDKLQLQEKPQEEEVTILFADIVNFTQICEQSPADQVAETLNYFMSELTEAVFAHGGTLDKFIGDAALVIFGAPVASTSEQQVADAINCARSILAKVHWHQRTRQTNKTLPFEIRIGLNRGKALVGVFGSKRRSEYTALGTTVNIASRIEALAQPSQLVFTAGVRAFVKEPVRSLGMHKLKGIEDPQEIFALDALAKPELKTG